MYMKKNKKDPSILDIFFGPGVNAGKKFDGNKARDKDGAKTYSHVQARRQGNDYVIQDGKSLVRPRNVNGRINSKTGY
ncbi:hypothetical protein [Sinomonas soli]